MAPALAAQVDTSWEIEHIPDEDLLYMRVHKTYCRDSKLAPIAFRDHEGGMSTDWSRYARPEQTRDRAKDPSKNAVVSMGVERVRAIQGLQVVHSPLHDNRAHTNVIGEKRWRFVLYSF